MALKNPLRMKDMIKWSNNTRWQQHRLHILQIFCQTFIISMNFFSYLWLWKKTLFFLNYYEWNFKPQIYLLVLIGHTITARSMLGPIQIIQEKEHTAMPAQRCFKSSILIIPSIAIFKFVDKIYWCDNIYKQFQLTAAKKTESRFCNCIRIYQERYEDIVST